MQTELKNKIALITGASSGIGMACAKQLAAHGMNLIIAARRIDRLEQLATDLREQFHINVLPLKLDVSNREQVKSSLNSLPESWENIDILINDAGAAKGSDKCQDLNLDNVDAMIATNINGVIYVTKSILPGMIARKSGHIVNLCSTAGHGDAYPGGNVYCATKHAVKALTMSLRVDLLGTGIRVSEVSPGLTHTEFSEVRWQDKKRANDFYHGYTPLVADDIADAIVYCLTRPQHVGVAEIIVMPSAQASSHYIHKDTGSSSVF